MEVLFEYRGSRSELQVGSGDNLTEVVTAELRRLGRTRALVLTGDDNLPNSAGRRQPVPEVYLLQKWSALWDCYVDVRRSNDVNDGDKLAVVARPKPPSKVYQLFCCATDSSLPNGNKVGSSSKHPVPRGEEIQTVNYQFRVVWDQEEEAWLQDLEQETSNAQEQGEEGPAAMLGPGEQYVRGSTGIASWKIICKQEPTEEEQVEAAGEEEVVSGAAVEESGHATQSDAAAERLGEEVPAENDLPEDPVEAGQDVGVADDQGRDMAGVGGEEETVQGGEPSDRGGGEEGGGEVLEHSSSPAVLEVTSEEVVNIGELAGDDSP